MGNKQMKGRSILTKVSRFLKSIFNPEMIGTIWTIVIGTIIELLCQIVVHLQDGEFNVEWIEKVFKDCTTYMQFANVFTMSTITWFIVGMAEKLNKQGHQVPKSITIITLIVIIITVLWYVLKGLLPMNSNIIWVSFILSVLSFILLMFQFRCVDYECIEQNSKIDDGIIAASKE